MPSLTFLAVSFGKDLALSFSMGLGFSEPCAIESSTLLDLESFLTFIELSLKATVNDSPPLTEIGLSLESFLPTFDTFRFDFWYLFVADLH